MDLERGLYPEGLTTRSIFFVYRKIGLQLRSLSISGSLRYLYTFSRLMRTGIPHLVSSIVFFLHDFSEVSPKGIYLCVEPFNLQ